MTHDSVSENDMDERGRPGRRDKTEVPGGASDSRRREFEETALPHLDALYGMALKLIRDPTDAEDLVQDAFVRAYRFFGQYERGTNCRAWLFTILRNTFINRYRKTRSQPDEIDFGAIEERGEGSIAYAVAPPAQDPESAASDSRLGEDVRAALDSLPPEYRMVVTLSIVEGYTYREIASIMSCPIGTVMSRLFRARQILQTRLETQARERGLLPREDGPAGKRTDGKYA